ncbi:hypothetical protein DXG01_001384 [Tephrocybe rancida]|nr:hypothetical protein DXG01_001384 [Tephrocybe rancida]
MPLVDAEEQAPLLTLACRFIPYDQWLTTHVDPAWKVKQVKLWILSKCLGIPFDAVYPSATRAAPSDVLANSQLGATPPGQRYRPASPITFAPDPRRRPISPILFAKGGKGKEKEKQKQKRKKGRGRTSAATGDASLLNSDIKPTTSPVKDGYEEDDEWDTADDGGSSFDETEIYRHSPAPPLPAPPLPAPVQIHAPTPPPLPPPSSAKWSKFNMNPSAYTLIRFSTGQALEDDLALTWYDLAAYELIELHSHDDVYAAPSTAAPSSTTASVTTHTTSSEHGHGGHNRNPSIYSLSVAGPNPPPAPPHKDKDHSKPVYLPHLNRSSLTNYILPYWEGPVRALRSVPVRSFMAPMPNFLNGYGYGYAGTEVNQRAMAFGIGHPPPFGVHQQGIRGVGGWDAMIGVGAEGNGEVHTKIEWRPRHVVVKEGMLTLCINREDTNPRHILPLTAFISISGSEDLVTYLRGRNQSHPPTNTFPLHSPTKSSKGKGATPSIHTGQSRHSTSTLGPVFSTRSAASDSDSDVGSSYQRSTRHKLHVATGNDPHDEHATSGIVGGEPIDELHIVCLRFKTVSKLKRVVKTDSNGLCTHELVPDTGEDKERERQRVQENHAARTSKKKEKKDKETGNEKGGGYGKQKKGKAKGFPWDRDGKEKEAGKTGKKDKRDWMPGFAVKKDRGGDKDKNKDKDRDKDRGGVNLGGIGMGVSLGLGLSGGMQDTKERSARDQERERERERAALSEADAEASITFAKRSEGASSSDGDAGLDMEEDGTADEGGDAMTTRKEAMQEQPMDKGKGKAPQQVAGDVDNGAEGDEEADADFDSDDDFPMSRAVHSGPHSASNSHAHPHSELASVVSGGDDGEVSDAWSSPRFAHTDSEDAASDGEWQEIGSPSGKTADAYRYGYRYGYQGSGTLEGGTTGRTEPESVHEEEDRLEKEKANYERRKAKERAKKKEEDQRKDNEKTEWIILDLGSDIALISLDQHTQVSYASYTATYPPALHLPSSPSYLNLHRLPHPHPRPPPFRALHLLMLQARIISNGFRLLMRRLPQPPLKVISGSRQRILRHPSALAALSHPGSGAQKTFGVLPYPEWRTEVTERAQRAGMGNVGRAMKWVLWERKAQLELDIEEVLRRHGEDDQASAESIRKKKREVTSLKNRRRSTTSTLTRRIVRGNGLSDTASGSVDDSDVSEETGRMFEMSDSEESSEAEWQGWMADIHRQRLAQEQLKREEVGGNAMATANAAASSNMSDGEYEEHLPVPGNAAEIRSMRASLEPTTVISVRSQDGMSPISYSTPGTLYSPSSSDSLPRRAMSFSPVDRSSSPAGTSANSHNSYAPSQSTSTAPLIAQTARKHPLPAGSGLSHSTSMYAPALRSDANVAEQNLRRPSMPIMTSNQTFSSFPAPLGTAIRSPTALAFSLPQPTPMHSPPLSPIFSSPFLAEDVPRQTPSAQPARNSSPTTMPRRASTAGLMTPGGGSLGRTTSVLTRGGILRKDPDKEADRLREKERRKEEKAREKEDKAKEKEKAKDLEREAKEARKLQRPKLSLATSSSHQLVPQPVTSLVNSNTRERALMRRVKSGSNLNEELIGDGRAPSIDGPPQAGKKKRGVFVARFVRGIDSAMDFADGR